MHFEEKKCFNIGSFFRKLNDLIHEEETRLNAFMLDLATDEGNVKARTFQLEVCVFYPITFISNQFS